MFHFPYALLVLVCTALLVGKLLCVFPLDSQGVITKSDPNGSFDIKGFIECAK